jgi:bacteriorhodopsin
MAGSLDTNPPNADRHITEGGTNWLWAVFAVMALATLGMVGWSFTRPRGTRFFHNIASIILATSTIAYFSMASDLGAAAIVAEWSRGHTYARQIWYVRFIQWFINFPLLLILLLSTTGLPLSDILTTSFFAWFVVVCGLVGALVATIYKWGYFVFGVLALMYIWSTLLGHGPRTTFNAGAGVRSGYVRGAGFVVFITMLYPIAWGLSEGGNVISPTGEAIFYGILDLLLGPIFLYYFIFGLRNVDYGLFGFHSGKYSDGAYGANGYGRGAAPGTAGNGANANAAPMMTNRV